MTTVNPQCCPCGNQVRVGHPTCGIVICLVNDGYERAVIAARAAAKTAAKSAARTG